MLPECVCVSGKGGAVEKGCLEIKEDGMGLDTVDLLLSETMQRIREFWRGEKKLTWVS